MLYQLRFCLKKRYLAYYKIFVANSILSFGFKTYLSRYLFLFLVISSVSVKAQIHYFKIAEARIQKYNPPHKNLAIIIDYTKNIFQERLYILDLRNGNIILSSRVSHAWNSGALYPKKYSNKKGSEMSSKGTFITGKKILSPKFGYAMLVAGLEIGVNNNAKAREIIFHSDTKMKTKWSNGCFATPEGMNKKIIDLTNNGTIVCVIDQ